MKSAYTLHIVTKILIVGLLCVVEPDAARAKRFARVLEKGTSVREIALRFYEREDFEVFVAAASGFKPYGEKTPQAGKQVFIPTGWTYRIRADDTWEDLGRDYLGDGRRGAILASMNHKDPEKAPPAGHLISMPFHVPFRATRPLSLQRIAKIFSAGLPRGRIGEKIRLIREYNFLKKPSIKAGQTILVPVFHVQVRRILLATEGPIPDPGAQRRVDAIAEKMKTMLDEGRYSEAASLAVDAMAEADVARENAARVLLYLCTAHVALDNMVLAEKAARKALELDSGIHLPPERTSPKVRKVFDKARKAFAR